MWQLVFPEQKLYHDCVYCYNYHFTGWKNKISEMNNHSCEIGVDVWVKEEVCMIFFLLFFFKYMSGPGFLNWGSMKDHGWAFTHCMNLAVPFSISLDHYQLWLDCCIYSLSWAVDIYDYTEVLWD